jgi:hypothetical protein
VALVILTDASHRVTAGSGCEAAQVTSGSGSGGGVVVEVGVRVGVAFVVVGFGGVGFAGVVRLDERGGAGVDGVSCGSGCGRCCGVVGWLGVDGVDLVGLAFGVAGTTGRMMAGEATVGGADEVGRA